LVAKNFRVIYHPGTWRYLWQTDLLVRWSLLWPWSYSLAATSLFFT